MPKGYWIARVDVSNEDGYKSYAAANPAFFGKLGNDCAMYRSYAARYRSPRLTCGCSFDGRLGEFKDRAGESDGIE